MDTQIVREGERFLIRGAILIDNAAALLAAGNALFARTGGLLDLSGATEVDSAAVSLLMEFQREARRNGVELRYANVPGNLKSLAQLYGVAELIPS
jgi:phospholipid transport system transporter-binding protein